MTSQKLVTGIGLLCGMLAAGCSEDIPLAVGPVEVARMTLLQGDHQEATPGVPLPTPFTVRVGTADKGVSGVTVYWTMISGEGTFEPAATAITNWDGLAQVRFTPLTHRAQVLVTAVDYPGQAIIRMTPVPTDVYEEVGYSNSPTACVAPCTQYRFYPDGSFGLRYPTLNEYQGSFVRVDSVITLTFAPEYRWGTAEGIVRGDSLFVTYDIQMQLSDFNNSIFVKVAGN